MAGDLWLLAHNPFNGRQLVGPAALGLGLAGAQLCEALLWGVIGLRENVVGATGRVAYVGRIDRLVARIRVERPRGVQDWLAFLRLSAADSVRNRLIDTRCLRPNHRLGRRVVHVPTEIADAPARHDRVSALATGALLPTSADAVLAGLVDAVGLSGTLLSCTVDGRGSPAWRQLVTDLPTDVRAVVAATEAAVGEAVLAPHH